MNKRIKGTVSAMIESDIKGVTMNKEIKGTVSVINAKITTIPLEALSSP